MTVTVRLFASYAEILGRSHIELTIPEGSTVADVIRSVNELPGGGGLPPAPLFAVNYSYSPSSRTLAHGDEIAIIPPVAGG